jgi:hypothetical protein
MIDDRFKAVWVELLALKRRLGTVAATGGGGGAITQLTGDVTAGPGSGSQVATIAAAVLVRPATVGATFDGGGTAIVPGPGTIVFVKVPHAMTLSAWEIVADQIGSVVVDVWKDTYANFPPTVADSIAASAKPTLSGVQKAQNTTLTGWTTSIAAGDWLAFKVDSATTVQRVTVQLTGTRP